MATDLYLPAVGGTAVEALGAGVDPEVVWSALVAETGAGEVARWIHRVDPKERADRLR